MNINFDNDIEDFINWYVHTADVHDAKPILQKLVRQAYEAGLEAASAQIGNDELNSVRSKVENDIHISDSQKNAIVDEIVKLQKMIKNR